MVDHTRILKARESCTRAGPVSCALLLRREGCQINSLFDIWFHPCRLVKIHHETRPVDSMRMIAICS